MANSELDQYLGALSREQDYRCSSVLKKSDFETTEEVYLRTSDGQEQGPFIRKTIAYDSGLGAAYERIFNEQSKQADCSFQHIPHMYECYKRDDYLVVVMEYIQGETLQDYIYRCDPSPELTAHIFPEICDAVSELHESFNPPLIHRDLKPSNIMVSNDQIYIIDFGIAREFKDEATADTMHFGTRAYAPPEQFGYGQTSVRSDVYALGMLLYFCLVEETPSARVVENKFDDSRIAYQLQRVLMQATAFDPQQRYGSARELKTAVQRALPGAASATTLVRAQEIDWKAMPKPAPRVSTKPPSKVRTVAGIAWNVAVVLCAATILAGSIAAMLNPSEIMMRYSPGIRVFGYAVMVPVMVVFYGFVLLDKSRLKRRFPNTVGQWRFYHFIIVGLIGTVAGFFFFVVMGMSGPQ